MTRFSLPALLTAAALATTAPPALAGGSISLSISPGSRQDAQTLQAGLLIYRLLSGGQHRAEVTQNGTGNAAALQQSGRGNSGTIHQDGSNHSATLNQRGRGNSYGIFQFGRGATANVTQRGRGRSGVLLQYGW